jgi:hypothetical protein
MQQIKIKHRALNPGGSGVTTSILFYFIFEIKQIHWYKVFPKIFIIENLAAFSPFDNTTIFNHIQSF